MYFGAGNGIQSFMHSRQMLYHWVPLLKSIFAGTLWLPQWPHPLPLASISFHILNLNLLWSCTHLSSPRNATMIQFAAQDQNLKVIYFPPYQTLSQWICCQDLVICLLNNLHYYMCYRLELKHCFLQKAFHFLPNNHIYIPPVALAQFFQFPTLFPTS